VAKDRIIAEASVPGANVSAVARSHGLTPQQVFAWRREAVRRAQEGDCTSGTAFAEVRVAGTPAVPCSIGPVPGVVELTVSDVTLRIGPSVPTSRVRDLLRAVRSA